MYNSKSDEIEEEDFKDSNHRVIISEDQYRKYNEEENQIEEIISENQSKRNLKDNKKLLDSK